MDPNVDERFAKGFRGKKSETTEKPTAAPSKETPVAPPATGVAVIIEPPSGNGPEEGDPDGLKAVGDAAPGGTEAKPLEGFKGYSRDKTGPGHGSDDSSTATSKGGPVTQGEYADGGTVEPPPAAGDEMPMTHNEKTWQGRLNKREQELRDREAAIQEREAKFAAGGEVTPKPGADPDNDGDPGSPETPAAEAAEGEPSTSGPSDDILAGAPADIQRIGREMSEDLGPEFISNLAKIMAYLAESKAGKIAADAVGPLREQANSLQSMVDAIIENFQSMHHGDIEDEAPDFEDLINSPEFEQWVMSQPATEQQRIVSVLQGGSAGRIIKVLKSFKDSLASAAPAEAKGAATIDTSALDAAAGVHSSGAVQPNLTGSSTSAGNADNDFARGFNRARRPAA